MHERASMDGQEKQVFMHIIRHEYGIYYMERLFAFKYVGCHSLTYYSKLSVFNHWKMLSRSQWKIAGALSLAQWYFSSSLTI